VSCATLDGGVVHHFNEG